MAATIYDIAEKAGVSIATVSRVFNNSNSVSEKTKLKVQAIADEVGYHPQAYAQGLASRKKNMIMAVVPIISNYFFMEVLSGIQDKLLKNGYELNIYNVMAGDNILDQVEQVIKKRLAEGYLLISIHLKDKDWERLSRYNVPVTLIDEHYEKFDSVSVDNVLGAYRATTSLIEAGHKRISMLSALRTSKPIADRLEGYKKALEDNDIEFSEELVIAGESTYRDGFTERGGYEAMKKMLCMNPIPDACFCASDIQAIGALKAMKDLGKSIPIIGYDDIEISEYVGLSTIRQPMRDMGYYATQNLIERIENRSKVVSQTIYSPEIIHRSSTNKIT